MLLLCLCLSVLYQNPREMISGSWSWYQMNDELRDTLLCSLCSCFVIVQNLQETNSGPQSWYQMNDEPKDSVIAVFVML